MTASLKLKFAAVERISEQIFSTSRQESFAELQVFLPSAFCINFKCKLSTDPYVLEPHTLLLQK